LVSAFGTAMTGEALVLPDISSSCNGRQRLTDYFKQVPRQGDSAAVGSKRGSAK
jgi:hypothetical protein